MKVVPRATVPLPVGSTFHKEFPPWVTPTISARRKGGGEIPPRKQKNSSQFTVYFDTLKPIFVVLTLTGILPVFRLNIGNKKIQVLLGGGTCMLMYILFAYLTYLMTVDVLQLILHDDDFSSIIVQVTLMMLLSHQLFYLMLSWPESISVNKYLIQWKEFQTQYELVTSSKLQLLCRRRLMVWLLVSAVVSGIGTIIVDKMDDKIMRGKISYIVLFYQLFVQLCFFLLWFSNSWAIIDAARQYNNHLARECASDITPEKLEDYRLVWMRLTELVRSGSSMLSYTMAMIVISPFTFEVIAAYNLTMNIIRSIQGASIDSQETVATAIAFLIYATLIYMFCNSGHCMTTECEKIQDVLLRHKPRSLSALPKINTKLRLFLRCLRSAPPLATLSGYVTINRKVFLHLSGVLVTYLIILVQFNISSIHTNIGNKIPSKEL